MFPKHFDGKRFYNPGAPQAPGLFKVLRWKLTSRAERSPDFISDVEQCIPPSCVEGGKLRRVLIQVGTRTPDRIQVLKKQETIGGGQKWVDFSGEEMVVQENGASLADGQTVAVSPGKK